ncbi:hypothetical protein PMAYCL1PPCAC_16944, partial [Pristionchus mayeri]
RTLTYFAVFYAILPYSLAYAALGILLYKNTKKNYRVCFQTALPMAILCSPFAVFVYAVFTQTDLNLAALWFSSCLWLCPSVQVF